jgi:hypothetical protein
MSWCHNQREAHWNIKVVITWFSMMEIAKVSISTIAEQVKLETIIKHVEKLEIAYDQSRFSEIDLRNMGCFRKRFAKIKRKLEMKKFYSSIGSRMCVRNYIQIKS